jgi:hypothetical protein
VIDSLNPGAPLPRGVVDSTETTSNISERSRAGDLLVAAAANRKAGRDPQSAVHRSPRRSDPAFEGADVFPMCPGCGNLCMVTVRSTYVPQVGAPGIETELCERCVERIRLGDVTFRESVEFRLLLWP